MSWNSPHLKAVPHCNYLLSTSLMLSHLWCFYLPCCVTIGQCLLWLCCLQTLFQKTFSIVPRWYFLNVKRGKWGHSLRRLLQWHTLKTNKTYHALPAVWQCNQFQNSAVTQLRCVSSFLSVSIQRCAEWFHTQSQGVTTLGSSKTLPKKKKVKSPCKPIWR